jgi:hypothetical protein
MTTYVAFIEESRMKFANATKPDRKSGGSGGTCGFFSTFAVVEGTPGTKGKARDLGGGQGLFCH